MWYRKEEGERFVTLRFTVDRIKIPFFNLISLLYETELYHHWFPFCKQSFDHMKISKTCKVCYQELIFPFPLKNRETIVCGKGVNRMNHNGTVLVMSKSYRLVNDDRITSKVGEFTSERRPEGLVENVIHFYGFEISPVSPNELSLRVCMLVDPQIPLIPDAMINYASKKFGDDMINKLLVFSQDFKGTEFEEKLKSSENAEFYAWLKLYVSKFCEDRGWQYDFPEY